MRSVLFKKDSGEALLLLNFHHIAVDLMSLVVLIGHLQRSCLLA